MTASRSAPSPDSGSRTLRDGVELLSSMRFAIALLTVICIASVIGTVVKQHEPINNYVNQFGPFWADVFGRLNLYSVYSAWWFLLILAFLVVSTSLCIIRNTPKILQDLRTYKENVREQSLRAFGHRAEGDLAESAEAAARRIGESLANAGWKVRLQSRESARGTGWMVAAKAGAANKLGYLAAHSAIVLVCIGGLFDGDLVVRAQTWFNGKVPYEGGGLIADVPEQHRLSSSNPTFRANLLVTEGTQSSTAILTQPKGVLLQELPFSVELKKFIVEYYSTGMPKLFASDIVIHDKDSGQQTEARVEVNHPVSHRGVQIYQSSFDDGGSRVKLKALPMSPLAKPLEVEGTIGGSTELSNGDKRLTLEFTGLRVINVENMSDPNGASASGADVRKVDLRHAIEGRLGAANKTATKKELRNVGPSVSYKLRDEAGQAIEFNNYMLPVDLGGGARAYLLGMRENLAEPMRYLRVPVDDRDGMDDFFAMRAALADPVQRERAVSRYVAQALDKRSPQLATALQASAARALDLFAGVDPALQGLRPAGQTQPLGGLQAVSRFMESSVPETERERASEVLVRILNGTLFEVLQLAREREGRPALDPDAAPVQSFMTQSVLSLSDAFFYPAPMSFMLSDFTHIQASVFQVARAPGKTVVYLGCLLLILGVFAMLYVRERRLWVWLAPGEAATHATMALSSNRKTMDGDREFETLKSRLLPP
jgi:cytochrome c biogenesis protein